MFISEKIVFVELHKTACTHIRNLLVELVGGRLEGKHNPPGDDQFLPGRAFFGSVRDPWEWYVSLWSYGCDGRGGMFSLSTHRRGLRGRGWKRNPVGAAAAVWQDLRGRDPGGWERLYTHTDDAETFRAWLERMMDPRYKTHLPLRYGNPSIMDYAGLLTYRYVHLFCRGPQPQLGGGRSVEDLVEYDRERCFITHFIRNERLEEDLLEALRACGVYVGAEAEARVLSAGRTNTSSRRRPASFYYTPETAALVARKEKVLVERFGYSAPV